MTSLRTKIIIGLVTLMTVLGFGTLSWLSWRLDHSYTHLERETAFRDTKRLLQALDAQLEQRDELLQSWSDWTEMAAFVHRPNTSFRQKELNPTAIAPFDQVHAPDAAVTSWLDRPYRQELQTLPVQSLPGCGLGMQQGHWSILCRRAIRDSTGVQAPQGILVASVALTDQHLKDLAALTGLPFQLHTSPAPVPDVQPLTRGPTLSSLLGQSVLLYDLNTEHIQLYWPVHDLGYQPVGHISLAWPRQLTLQAGADLRAMQWQLRIFFVLIALTMLLMLDRLVIARLLRFTKELTHIETQGVWHQRITQDGNDEITALSRRTNSLLSRIQTQLDRLKRLSSVDGLTELANRRSFDDTLQQALLAHKRYARPLSLILLDVDHFKLYNDHYGHTQGDVALKQVAQCLKTQARRPGDFPARVGGEEFAVILEDTDEHGALQWIEATQARLKAMGLEHRHNSASDCLTISAGVTSAEPDDTPETLYARADKALYQAKVNGRNRAETARPYLD